jgi:hypothetical protein
MLDMNLSGTSSRAVSKTLPTRDVPFVFPTGYGAHLLRDAYRVRLILKKPFSYEELADALGRFLSGECMCYAERAFCRHQ